MNQRSRGFPVEESLPQIKAALADNRDVILSAAPGAGKSTIVPLALKDEAWLAGKRIVILQPRRIAAVALARRMASLDASPPGAVIGHRVRFDSNITSATRIEVLTEGILTRRLQKDPLLEDVGLVIFDEFHERSVHTDLCLALCREIKREVRPDLRLMLMSATADLELAQSFLDRPQLIEGKGFLYPVDIQYRPFSSGRDRIGELAGAIAQIVAESGRAEEFLVFLPGMGEIMRVSEHLAASLSGHQIMHLHGSLPVSEQEKVLRPAARPRIILSTNIAETSLTIDGITVVIDSGEARWLEIDSQSGLEQLSLHRISRSSAAQRAGRAGRLKPGRAYRLWSQPEHHQMAENDPPEILRIDPTSAVLELFAWGCRDPLHFNWLQSPGPEKIARSLELLQMLGAVDESGKITTAGRKMSELPLEPRLARMLIVAAQLGIGETAALAAAVISEKDFLRTGRNRVDADLEWRLQLLAAGDLGSLPPDIEIDRNAVRRIYNIQKQLLELMRRKPAQVPTISGDKLHRALLAAFPDRVCQRRSDGRSGSYTICGGQGFVISENGLLPGEPLILALRLDQTQRIGDGRIFLACALEESLLAEQRLYQRRRELFFSRSHARVMARERVFYGKLMLRENEAAVRPDEADAAVEILVAAALADPGKALALDADANRNFINRVTTLKACRAGADFPAIDDDWLAMQIRALASTCRGFADMQRQSLEQLYLQNLSWKNREKFEKLVPERFTVPSGSALCLQYQAAEAAPILAVKIQELFGMAQTPAICDGQCRLLVHLLSPAGRPVQITADLASFWQTGYPQVIKELKGRYPKHPWPDDPTIAVASRGTKKQIARRSST
ncbi:MAG: ATP-dependent helicase HrpB [Candidatus Riflebacteria bacterium HGW-Riflebacteria-2]|jgi:ATP-dependent helicase HrpB|nr:MAG: ATP-dependent helicase HrpB [Candidatus Riflebacteria bacterium HGW-Riflebacteria-2]